MDKEKVIARLEEEVARCERAAESWRRDAEKCPWDEDAHYAAWSFRSDAESFRKAIRIVKGED